MPRKKQAISGDAEQVSCLLAWGRAHGVAMTSVTVGTCHVELSVPSSPTIAPQRRSTPTSTDRESIYKQFGGEAFSHIVPPDDEAGELRPALRVTR